MLHILPFPRQNVLSLYTFRSFFAYICPVESKSILILVLELGWWGSRLESELLCANFGSNGEDCGGWIGCSAAAALHRPSS